MDIGLWLRSVGLEEYGPAFDENKITVDLLGSLTADDLRDIGVVRVGDRRRLLDAIAKRGAVPGTPAPAEEKASSGAERRQITVLFCDLVGSTALSARLDPEDMREVIGAYHRRCAETITKWEGFVAKYMGDGVLAYFGYPRAHEDDAERAIRAGLALVEAVAALPVPADYEPRARIGIATGMVVVGDLIGEGAAREQGVVGDTPNLAARLQTLAEPGAVVIAEETRRLTGGLFEHKALGPAMLKGFATPVAAWQVLGEAAVESRFEALRPARTPLVGRAEELELLTRRWARAKAGEGRVVLLSGEAGIGKSRITAAFEDHIGGEPHVRLRYFCSPQRQDSALHPFIGQLERAAGFARGDGPEEKLAKLETLLGRSRASPEEIGLIAEMAGVPTNERHALPALAPPKRKERLFAALLAQVSNLARAQPVLVQFEDLHWVDPTSLELLGLFVERLPSLRVLFVATTRPEFALPWPAPAHLTVISLARLDRREGAALAERVAGRRLPFEVMDQILARTDGVPLFVEELTKSVIESGLLHAEDGAFVLREALPALAIPATLHDSLMARLDRLAPVREVAQFGAAIGREFSYELIAAVSGMAPARLEDALAQLAKSELIYARGQPPHAVYAFKHALVQDAAYGTLLRAQRQMLHGRVVAALDRQFPETAETQPEVLAFHCAEAGQIEKAVEYWLKAGQQSVARSAMSEAVTQLQKGLALLPSLPDNLWRQERELDLLTSLGPALIATKGYSAPELGKILPRASALAEQLDRADYVVPLLFGLWGYYLVRSELGLAYPLAARIEQSGQARQDQATELLGRALNGITCFFAGDFVAARAILEPLGAMSDPAFRAIYRALTGADYHVVRLQHLAWSLVYLGHLAEGQAMMDEAVAEARRLDHAYTLVFVLAYNCVAAKMAAAPEEAKRRAEEVMALSKEHGFPLWLSYGMMFHGWSLAALGDASGGAATIADGLALFRATGSILVEAQGLAMLGEACGLAGRVSEGLEHLAEAARVTEATDERHDEAELHRTRGDLLVQASDAAAAEQAYRRALDIARRQSARVFELRAATGLAALWRDAGKGAAARDLLAPVCAWFPADLATPDLDRARRLLAELA
jgi:class 3 adenylate cyclase/predicted ATPase